MKPFKSSWGLGIEQGYLLVLYKWQRQYPFLGFKRKNGSDNGITVGHIFCDNFTEADSRVVWFCLREKNRTNIAQKVVYLIKSWKERDMILQTIPFVKASALSFLLIPSPSYTLALFSLPHLRRVGYLFKNWPVEMAFGIIRLAIMLFWTVGHLPFWVRFT